MEACTSFKCNGSRSQKKPSSESSRGQAGQQSSSKQRKAEALDLRNLVAEKTHSRSGKLVSGHTHMTLGHTRMRWRGTRMGIEMAGRGRDDAAIAEALGMLAGVLGGNPNVVGLGAARQLSEFQRNNPPMFKGAYDPDGA
ncbi:hypothetical protein KIW84_062379 [Lathyrus oleraceus]|uniref:Uncharacterized protein n=1 Tax=Pisum sativum TaxID=3888 RepID=A0A9D5A3I2_PEA|nr:hypothetical protein KIW84_062379 [Pisum sativum]